MRTMSKTTAGKRMASAIIRATQRRGASADGVLGTEVDGEEGSRGLVSGVDEYTPVSFSVTWMSAYSLRFFHSKPTTVGAVLRAVTRKRERERERVNWICKQSI